MGRDNRKLFYIISFIFIIGVAVWFWYDLTNSEPLHESYNRISYIEGFSLKKNGDNGSVYILQAVRAEMYSEDKFVFDNCSFLYNDPEKDITVNSKRCSYEVDKEVTLEDSIKAIYNNLSIFGGEKSVFVYDVRTEIGELHGGVVAKEERNRISSDRMVFKRGEKYLSFLGNVEVIYVR
ncbi:MAG: LPS export ABC transporter periplasmic protein LptC [Deferribacterales bacterium]